jgi:hypothetical protein
LAADGTDFSFAKGESFQEKLPLLWRQHFNRRIDQELKLTKKFHFFATYSPAEVSMKNCHIATAR